MARERISHHPDMLKAKDFLPLTFPATIKQNDKELKIKMGMFIGGQYCKHHLNTVLF